MQIIRDNVTPQNLTLEEENEVTKGRYKLVQVVDNEGIDHKILLVSLLPFETMQTIVETIEAKKYYAQVKVHFLHASSLRQTEKKIASFTPSHLPPRHHSHPVQLSLCKEARVVDPLKGLPLTKGYRFIFRNTAIYHSFKKCLNLLIELKIMSPRDLILLQSDSHESDLLNRPLPSWFIMFAPQELISLGLHANDLSDAQKEGILSFLNFYFCPVSLKSVFDGFSYTQGVFYCERINQLNQVETITEAIAILDRQATHFFVSHRSESCALNLGLSAEADDATIIATILNKKNGIIVSGPFHQQQPKQYLLDHMSNLKQGNVKTLYVQHILYDTMQKVLNEYHLSPSNTPMPRLLKDYLIQLDLKAKIFDPNKGLLAIVKKAKEEGIRVVALNTETSHAAGYDLKSDKLLDRTLHRKVVNFQAFQIFLKEQKGEKFAVFCNPDHIWQTVNILPDLSYQKLPGMTELFNGGSVFIQNDEAPNLKFNVEGKHFKRTPMHIDIYGLTGFAHVVRSPFSETPDTTPATSPIAFPR